MNEGGNIIRTVFGTSYKEAEKIHVRATKENLEYTTPNEARFHGKNGGKKFAEYQEKEENDLDKEGPWLIMRSAKKKGRNPEDTATAADLLYGDYPNNANGIEKLKQEIKQEYIKVKLDKKEKDTFPLIKSSDDFIRKEAEIFAQEKIDNLKPYLEKTNDELFVIFESKIKMYSRDPLEDVAVNILKKMKANTGGTVSSKTLTNAAENHASFVDFASITEWCIKQHTSKKDKIQDLVITMNAKASDGKLYKLVAGQDGGRPIFNTIHDSINGLQIMINDVWAYEVRILRYRKMYTSLFIELEYTLYDHFGLDFPDIYKFDQEIFYVWFYLQHFRGYKPVITKMKINREYPMMVPENWK